MAEQRDADRPKRDHGYKTGSWAGQVLYQCTTCPFDTFDEAKIIEHVDTLGQPGRAPAD